MTEESPDAAGPPATEDRPEVFPDPEELPDEPVSADELSPFEEEPSDFDDLNEFATAEWNEGTTARERVRAVVRRAGSPKSADEIADIAAVSPTTARNELSELAEKGRVLAEETSNGTLYQRDPDWYLMERVRQLSQSESLLDHIQSLQQELNEYRDAFGTDMPEEAIVSDGVLSNDELQDVSRWRTAKRDLTFLRAAYRFREARECAFSDSHDSTDNDTRVSTL